MTQDQAPAAFPGTESDRSRRIPPSMPFDYLAGLVRWLGRAPAVKVLTYADLNLSPAMDANAFAAEFRAWHQAHLRSRFAHVLLQYDVDSRPDLTLRLLRVHIDAGVPACVMVFNKRVFDQAFREKGKLIYDQQYNLDFGILREFQAMGGVVGYHCNTWERAMFEEDKARSLFKQDIDSLRREIEIRFFSMHGGPLDSHGRSNAHMHIDDLMEELGLVWVHNGRSVDFHRNWDDGGSGRKSFRVRNGDAAEALGLCDRGQRLRLLFHPQYYRVTDPSEISFHYQAHFYWYKAMREWFADAAAPHAQASPGLMSRILSFGRSARPTRQRSLRLGAEYWGARSEEYRQPPSDVSGALSEIDGDTAPIFVNGMSRSGTTLLAGLFDVHEDIAMSYELYPNYLVGQGEQAERYIDFSQVAFILRNAPEEDTFNLLAEMGERSVASFVACAGHSDLAAKDVGDALFWFLKKGNNLFTYLDALRFCGLCAHIKRLRVGKRNWGMKIQTKFARYHALWPNARHIYIIRDGRDILASQLNTGAFRPEPAQLGQNWAARVKNFQSFLMETSANGAVVRYEALVRKPRETLTQLCDELKLPFSEEMLRHHEHDISLLHKPRGQLSAARVGLPIDDSSIGRWRRDLSPQQVDAFMTAAADTIHEWGYHDARDTAS